MSNHTENTLNLFFNKKENWRLINDFLELYQIPEAILIKTHGHYDSNKCLKTQVNLTPYFCFKYLYNSMEDTNDNRVDYNDILSNFKNKYTHDELHDIYLEVINNNKKN